MQTQTKYEERRQTERRVSPAVGDFALEDRGKLLAENERLRRAAEKALYALEALPTNYATAEREEILGALKVAP